MLPVLAERVDIVEKNLCSGVSVERRAPMWNLDPTIDEGVAGLKQDLLRTVRDLDPDRPRRVAAQTERHAGLAGRTVRVPVKDVAPLVDPVIGIRRAKSEAGLRL